MFKYIGRKLKSLLMEQEQLNFKDSGKTVGKTEDNNKHTEKISNKLEDNIKNFKKIFGESLDIIYRTFSFGDNGEFSAGLIYVEGLNENFIINETIMKVFMYDSKIANIKNIKVNIDFIEKNMLSVAHSKRTSSQQEIIDACLSGETIFILDGSEEALIIHSEAWESRGVEEAKTEAVVRGPREGFSENIATNMALIRRRIKSPNLVFESMRVGRQTRTSVCIAYLKDIADPKLIQEVKERLKKIKIDAILESGYIEQLIEDEPKSIFPTIGNSEKSDTAAAKILEGRACILVDGTPFVLTMPMLFVEGFQSAEDYYSRPYLASMIRMLRYMCFFISIFAPVTYVVLSTFHQELIPTTLLFTMAAGREGVPFPAVVEAGLMIITFEILREAGVRLPRPVGQAVSIVGALVIGEAAVSAGLVGGLLVIVIALTAVSSFVVPVYTDVVSILRIVFLILGGALGIFGLGIGILIVFAHAVSLKSFGVPYFSPLAPLVKDDIKDTLVRAPLWKMNKRPVSIAWKNIFRQDEDMKPNFNDKEEN
ncbi:spore germination protein [Clostridium fungisolvens]|uniref:Spore germination protein B1 n=1 Tax=Clostridium fungisolvens TaxID=1604897 RepID=A0A6V8SQB6_9CLOT|nr:spore germination protein [Clostridium fungisolvens]GFP77398.1 Spore germination protein B1 [Clostridium fungisolvens]